MLRDNELIRQRDPLGCHVKNRPACGTTAVIWKILIGKIFNSISRNPCANGSNSRTNLFYIEVSTVLLIQVEKTN
jgi:hypothetical protein